MRTQICRLSIIIPAYNVERYIGETLDSIVKWSDTRDDVEIIVVDDGSPDNSYKIVKDCQKRHSNISLIRQENKGLGGARNTGIENAQGEYVWFVDSDDWVLTEKLPDIMKVMEEESPQALAMCASDVRLDNTIKQRFNFNDLPQKISGVEMLRNGRFSFCAPFTIYNRKYLNDNALRFQEHLFHEDNEFTPRAYYRLKNLRLLNLPLYLVRPNPNSICRSKNFKKNFDLVKVAVSLNDFKNRNMMDRETAMAFDYSISIALNSALSNSDEMSLRDYEQFSEIIGKQRTLFKSFIHSSKIKHKLQGVLFAMIPYNPVTTYNKIMKKFLG